MHRRDLTDLWVRILVYFNEIQFIRYVLCDHLKWTNSKKNLCGAPNTSIFYCISCTVPYCVVMHILYTLELTQNNRLPSRMKVINCMPWHKPINLQLVHHSRRYHHDFEITICVSAYVWALFLFIILPTIFSTFLPFLESLKFKCQLENWELFDRKRVLVVTASILMRWNWLYRSSFFYYY